MLEKVGEFENKPGGNWGSNVMVQSSEQLKIDELFCAIAQTFANIRMVGSSKGILFIGEMRGDFLSEWTAAPQWPSRVATTVQPPRNAVQAKPSVENSQSKARTV